MEALELCLRAIDKQLHANSDNIVAILDNQAHQDHKIEEILTRLEKIEKKRVRPT